MNGCGVVAMHKSHGYMLFWGCACQGVERWKVVRREERKKWRVWFSSDSAFWEKPEFPPHTEY